MAPSPRKFFHDAIHAATILHSFFRATLLRGLCCVVMVTVMVMVMEGLMLLMFPARTSPRTLLAVSVSMRRLRPLPPRGKPL